ncbi:universal stress protein [Nitrospira sp.]|nr:universal stress protein [Nitrospira sp.]
MSSTAHGFHLTHRHVVHPTDFSDWSQSAFHHAVKLALVCRSHLTLLHIDPKATATDFEDFPRVRPLLSRWGLLPEDSPKEKVQDLGLYVRKVRGAASRPAQAIVHHVTSNPADLIVLACHRREGIARWLHRSVGEPIARAAHTPALFVPAEQEGFISASDGSLRLRRILLPAARTDTTQVAADTIDRLGRLLGCASLDIHLIHVDDIHLSPAIQPPDYPGWTWQATRSRGNVLETILDLSTELKPDLIVMATEGHTSWADMIHGSTTEQVLRQGPCPVLALPVY